jgi:PilZ domain
VTAGSTPEINTLVDLRLSGDREYPSRVEDVGETTWTLAAPFGGAVVDPPTPGGELQVRWTGTRGRYTAPVRLVAVSRGAVTTWVVEPAGEVHLEQRRRFARAGGGEPVSVRAADPADAPDVTGKIVDISEGGIRCWLSGTGFAQDQEVVVTVSLADERMVMPGTVYKASERDGGKGLDVVVTFDLDEDHAGLVRRYVMQAQLRARRAAADAVR